MGQLLMDAGQALRDGGSAHAQVNCKWHVKWGPGLGGLEEQVEAGWEPFGVDRGYAVLRRCK